jgi:hypothetical protein
MASLDTRGAAGPTPAQTSVDPEALARLVLRCRELSGYLAGLEGCLPGRADTPFLFGQFTDAARKLIEQLRRLAHLEEEARDERGGILKLLGGKKRRSPSGAEQRIDLQGNAWTIPVTELVNFLSHSGKSGILWVTTADETFVLEFARGSLVHATSNGTPREFRLGEILLREGMLERDELETKIVGARSADELLGSYLVKSGRLTSQELQRALAIQVQELFHRLMDAENAIYRFQEGVQMLRTEGLEVNTTQLLLESARKKDEERRASELAAAPAPPVAQPAPSGVPAPGFELRGSLEVLDDPLAEGPAGGPAGAPAPAAELPGTAGAPGRAAEAPSTTAPVPGAQGAAPGPGAPEPAPALPGASSAVPESALAASLPGGEGPGGGAPDAREAGESRG